MKVFAFSTSDSLLLVSALTIVWVVVYFCIIKPKRGKRRRNLKRRAVATKVWLQKKPETVQIPRNTVRPFGAHTLPLAQLSVLNPNSVPPPPAIEIVEEPPSSDKAVTQRITPGTSTIPFKKEVVRMELLPQAADELPPAGS